jgi:hypothetical protein
MPKSAFPIAVLGDFYNKIGTKGGVACELVVRILAEFSNVERRVFPIPTSVAHWAASLSSSFQRDHDSQCLAIEWFRSMTLANSVFHQQAISRANMPRVTLARSAFDLASKDNKQLAPG